MNTDVTKTAASGWVWFTPKWPLPADDGARMATTSLLKHLSSQGQSIHLVSFVPVASDIDVSEATELLGVSSVSLIQRPTNNGALDYLRSALTQPRLPITLAPFGSREAADAVEKILAREPGAPLIIDGLHAGAWMPLLDPGDRPIVYRAHNVEADIWQRAAADESNPLRSRALTWQERKVRKFEKYLCQRSDLVLPVSDDDGELFASIGSDARIHTVPIGLDVPDQRVVPQTTEVCPLLFIGRLDWPPNRDGLKWFLEKVWPDACRLRPELKLQIIGSGDGKWLDGFLNLPGVSFYGRVESVDPYYHSCIATLVPIYYGSGTRVKAIESSLFRRTCISTTLGVEGLQLIPGEEYLRCESAQDWIDCLVSVDHALATRIGDAACQKVSSRFDAGAVAIDMQRTVQSIAA